MFVLDAKLSRLRRKTLIQITDWHITFTDWPELSGKMLFLHSLSRTFFTLGRMSNLHLPSLNRKVQIKTDDYG